MWEKGSWDTHLRFPSAGWHPLPQRSKAREARSFDLCIAKLVFLYKPYWRPDVDIQMWCKMWERRAVLHWGWSAEEGAKQLDDGYVQAEASCLNWFVFFLVVAVGLRGQHCSLLYTFPNLGRCPPYDVPQYSNTDTGCHPNLKAGAEKYVGRGSFRGIQMADF